MAICYYRLFDKLNRSGLKKTDLKNEPVKLSPATLAKLSRNEIVTTEIINRICEFLECQPEEILEWIPDKEMKND